MYANLLLQNNNKHIFRLCNYENTNIRRKLFEIPANEELPNAIQTAEFHKLDMNCISTHPQNKFNALTLRKIDDWFEHKFATTGSQIKGRRMALNNFLKMIHCYISCNKIIYLKGMCYAEKSKHTVYCVCVLLDKNGVIIQSNCLCPAGSGFEAACKHVAAVLYGVEHYGQTGKTLEFSSCTSKLQTWHVPTCKKISNKLRVTDFFPEENIFEKKPQTDDVVNRHINCRIPSSITETRNANMRAYFADHNYALDMDKNMLDGINRCDKNQIKSIEQKTRNQSKSKLWHEMRKTRITASVAYNVVRTVKSGKMSVKLAHSIIQPKPFSNSAVSWGKNHESIALQNYEKITNNNVIKCGLFIDENINYLAASPDGILDDHTAVVEVKCPYKYRFHNAEEVDYVKNMENFESHPTICNVNCR